MVTFENGDSIATKTLVWAAGVSPIAAKGIDENCYGKGKRLLVDAYNKVNDLQDVYAIGDACLQTTDKKFPKGHPQLAQVAIQQGKNLAKNLVAQQKGEAQKPFLYFDKGSMAIIGEYKAVSDLSKSKMHLKGFIAWIAWMFVHLTFFTTHSNRIRTLYYWTSAFIKKDNTFKMIIRPSKKEAQATGK